MSAQPSATPVRPFLGFSLALYPPVLAIGDFDPDMAGGSLGWDPGIGPASGLWVGFSSPEMGLCCGIPF